MCRISIHNSPKLEAVKFPFKTQWHTVSYLCHKQTVAYLNNIILFSNKNKQAIKHEDEF